MEPIPSLFNRLPDAPDGSFQPGAALPLVVRTSEEQWAYAARFSRSFDAPVPSAAVLIRLALNVSFGIIGVGCVNVDETAFIDETLLSPTPATTTVDVLIPRPADLGPLIVRNASPSGASEVSVLGLECFALDAEPDCERAPGLSDPSPCPNWSRYYGTSGGTIEERLRVQRYLSMTEPHVLRWVDGLSVRIVPTNQLSRALYVSGTYEPNTLCVVQALLRPGDCFIDVGANVGLFSLVASRWVGPAGHVYSFEPSAREYEALRDNLRRNGLSEETAFRLAVTSQSGQATLRVATPEYAGLNTLAASFPYPVDTERFEDVDTITLDEFIARQRISNVALVKLDIEGAEAAVLRGAEHLLRTHRPALIVEVFSRSLESSGSSQVDVEQLLTRAGYRLYSISDPDGRLVSLETLSMVDEQNVVALPIERVDELTARVGVR